MKLKSRILIKLTLFLKMKHPPHPIPSMETEDFEGCNFDVEKGNPKYGHIEICKQKYDCYIDMKRAFHRLCEIFGWVFCGLFIIFIFYLTNGILNEEKSSNTRLEKEHLIDNNYTWSHYYENPPQISHLHSGTYHWSKHHTKKCSDYDYGCCTIYDDGQKWTLSLYKVIPYDKKHTNCPTYGDLIHNYNIWRENYMSKNNETNCDIQECCHLNTYEDELKNRRNPIKNISDYDITIKYSVPEYGSKCPTIHDIWWQYDIDNYADPDYFPWWLVFLGFIICCLGIHSSKHQ